MSDDETEKKISFTTDYMIDKLQNSAKLVSTDKRLSYNNDNSSKSSDASKYYEDDDGEEYYDKNDDNTKKTEEASILDAEGEKYEFDEKKNNANNKNVYNQLFDCNDDYDTLPPNQQLLKRLEVMTELGELVKYSGIKLTQPYNINSDYYTMKCELMIHKNIKSKDFFVSNLTNCTCYFAAGLESANRRYNPFDLNLDGWSEGVESQTFELSDIWSEIYTKYGSPGKNMAPEWRLFYCLVLGPIMYDRNKKQEEEQKKKFKQFQLYEDALKQMKQVKHVDYANKMVSQNNMQNDIQKQLKEQKELIKQQQEMLKNQQLNMERIHMEKINNEKRTAEKNEEMRRQDYDKMTNFFKNNLDSRDKNIKNQLEIIKQNINNSIPDITLEDDKRNADIKNAINKLENKQVEKQINKKQVSKTQNKIDDNTTSSTTDKSSENDKFALSEQSKNTEESRKSKKSIFSKKGKKRIINIKTN